MWKNNDFEYESKAPGYLKGFSRRFYQNSIDHRGIPEAPGRVVTLVKGDEDDRVYGMGYKIETGKEASVLEHLDHREKNGYDRHETIFYPIDDSPPKPTVVYVANEENPSWNKNHNLSDIAEQIHEASGPSGPNPEYVYNLCDAMRKYFKDFDDPHLFELEEILREMEEENLEAEAERNQKEMTQNSTVDVKTN